MGTKKKYFWENLSSFSSNIALIGASSKESFTYFYLEKEAQNLSDKLTLPKKGLIFLFTTNNSESVIAYVASLKSGNAVLLLDEKLNDEIRTGLIENYKPDFIISSSDISSDNYGYLFNYCSLKFYDRQKRNSVDVFPDLSVLLSTSGTTGSPKLVRLSYKNIQSNAESIVEYLKIDDNEKPITTLPINYSYGLSVINSHLLQGSTIVLTEKTVFFRDFWDQFNEFKCTSFAGVPYTYTMLKRINFNKIDLPTLKYFTQAGGKLSEEFIRHFNQYALEKGIKFFVMYGQTEATARITYVPAERLSDKIGSIGISIPNGELKIMNDGNEITKANEVGEIVYKGDNVMLGYAETTDDLSKGDELKGILFTGDLGYKDADGFYYVTGRMKRFIKIFGLRINLDEVQKMIENHFGISAACTGKDELLKILVHSDDHLTEVKVKEEVMKMYKLNFKSIIVKSTNQIPTNSSGKYDYNKINEMFESE
ncbi:MAG TPA: AMP-binding protein [Ignavibacteriaceae bacterium]|nr:AMP-binding protein [Ignavibacteriaceae bacterium]